MCTMSSVYPIKNYKLKIIQPKWLEDLNNTFRKKLSIKTYKAFKVEDGQIRARRPITCITNEWGQIDYGHKYYGDYLRGWCDEFGCNTLQFPVGSAYDWEFIPNESALVKARYETAPFTERNSKWQ